MCRSRALVCAGMFLLALAAAGAASAGIRFLFSANGATPHAIVFEDEPVGVSRVTDRYVRAANDTAVAPDLAHGATATFSVDVNLTGIAVDWSTVHAVVLVDYRPGGATGAYDMLQAFFSP